MEKRNYLIFQAGHGQDQDQGSFVFVFILAGLKQMHGKC